MPTCCPYYLLSSKSQFIVKFYTTIYLDSLVKGNLIATSSKAHSSNTIFYTDTTASVYLYKISSKYKLLCTIALSTLGQRVKSFVQNCAVTHLHSALSRSLKQCEFVFECTVSRFSSTRIELTMQITNRETDS